MVELNTHKIELIDQANFNHFPKVNQPAFSLIFN